MRLLLYNIRYGTGGKRFLFPWSGYLRKTGTNLKQIIRFMASVDPDIMGLIEVDEGSYRSDKQNQAEIIANALGHYHTYKSKYDESSAAHFLPLMNKQGNAFLTRDTIPDATFHYFDKGVKRLVIELEMEHMTVFLVHLALNFRVRHHQLGDLYSLVKSASKPQIVAGDFNALWGDREIALFLAATNMTNANEDQSPSFPSWAPRRQLDFILHNREIRSRRLHMPRVTFSDHLPLVWDFDIR